VVYAYKLAEFLGYWVRALLNQFMPMKIRSVELARLSRVFKNAGYLTTAGWIEQLSKKMLMPKVKERTQELLLDLKDAMLAFRGEFIGSGENWKYRERCFDTFEKIILEMIKITDPKTPETMDKIFPALKTGGETLRNIAEVYLALVSPERLSDKRRYYGFCFLYLLMIEGLYDENIKILYIFKKALSGEKVDYEDIQEKPLWDFKNEIEPVFFEGYNNRIRNAIAHAKFRFEDRTGKMAFRDRKTRHSPAFKKSLSLREFGIKYYGKVDSFCRLRLYYMLLLGVRDLVFAQKPFGRIR